MTTVGEKLTKRIGDEPVLMLLLFISVALAILLYWKKIYPLSRGVSGGYFGGGDDDVDVDTMSVGGNTDQSLADFVY